MNNQYFYEEFFLMYLYKVDSINTEKMEPLFDSVDPQLINNVISNRTKSTSYIRRGYLNYDAENSELSITKEGKEKIESRFSGHRA